MEDTRYFIIERRGEDSDISFDDIEDEIRDMLENSDYRLRAVMTYEANCDYCDGIRDLIKKHVPSTEIENYK